MKKITVLILAVCLVLICAGCGVKGWKDDAGSSSSQLEEGLIKKIDDKSYENSLKGLSQYLKDAGAISGDAKEMNASMIGAASGEKYSFGNIIVELYEFDLANLGEEANKVISDVKETGKFEILGAKVEAVLSENGKYLMVYADSKNNEELKKEVLDTFAAFKKG